MVALNIMDYHGMNVLHGGVKALLNRMGYYSNIENAWKFIVGKIYIRCYGSIE